MKRIISIISLALIFIVSAAAADKATAVFTVNPQMSCVNCENKIKNNLRFEKGIKSITTSLKDQTVTIEYDPAKISTEAIADAFSKIGYQAQQVEEGKCAKKTATCGGSEGKCCGKKEGCNSTGCKK